MDDETKKYVKIIIVAIILAIIIGIILSYIYSSVKENDPNNNKVEDFVGDGLTEIDSIDSNKNNTNDTESSEANVEINYGNNYFYLNNDNPITEISGYERTTISINSSNNKIQFSYPQSWKQTPLIKGDGVRIEYDTIDMTDVEASTYDECLEQFKQKIKEKKINSIGGDKLSFTSRQIQIGDKNYTILMTDEYHNTKVSYLCLFNGGTAYYLEVHVSDDSYNSEMISTIDTIFKSFVIY